MHNSMYDQATKSALKYIDLFCDSVSIQSSVSQAEDDDAKNAAIKTSAVQSFNTLSEENRADFLFGVYKLRQYTSNEYQPDPEDIKIIETVRLRVWVTKMFSIVILIILLTSIVLISTVAINTKTLPDLSGITSFIKSLGDVISEIITAGNGK